MKRYKLIAVLLVVALVAVLCAACTVTEQPQITVKVNGKEVKANGTVYAVEFDNDVTKAVIEATATVGKIDGTGTFDLKEGNNEFVLTLKANDSETKYTVKVTRKASEKPADVTLAEVKVGETVLTAAAGKYATTVGYEVSSVTVAATATDSAATVDGTGEKTLVVGKNEVTLTVKSGEATQTYTVEITREAAVLTLAEVKVGETTLTADGNGVYKHTVANTVSVVTIAATATKSYATVEGAGEKTLALGENTFTLTVKADDSTTEQYTVKVTRETADLTLKEVKIGDEVLTAQDRTYTCNVANDVTEVTLSATANNGDATLQGAGTKQNLVVGENRFKLVVSVGEEKATYTVVVNRAKSSVKTIASITVDGVDATYNQENVIYTATVGKFTANVEIALTSSVSSYETDKEIGTLTEGENEFVITVTAEDGTTATYKLVLNVVLPEFNVSYIGNIDGAVTNESYTYKYGEKPSININLAEAYTQSYNNLVVTYKVGDGEAKSVTLDENYGFEVPSAEAIGDIVVEVKGIAINTYTITYHRGNETTTETVEHGKDAQNAAITPNTETKDVLDGYTYMHDEKWVTENGGMIVATLTKITANMNVYYKDEVLVYSDVKTGHDNSVYKSLRAANVYLQEVESTLTFKVLVTAYKDGETENTSFLLYGSRFSDGTGFGVKVEQQDLNKWFTVVVKVADKKVTVYNPDGTIQKEETISECSADNFGYFVHADAKIAAVNPAIPELCTVTYLDETGGQLKVEKVVKGTAATYTYSKPSEDLGDGYKRIYNGTTWVNAGGENVDLTAVSANVTVTYKSAEVLVYKNIAKYDDNSGYKPVVSINKFIIADSNKIVRFKIRLNNASGTAFNIYESTGYTENKIGQWVEGDDLNKKWYLVEFDLNTGVCKIYNDGVADAGHTMTFAIIDINKISVVVGAGSVDVAAVNVEIVEYKYYDSAKKTNLLHKEWTAKDSVPSYQYVSNADNEGYVQIVDSWTAIGTNHEYYPSSSSYIKHYDKGTLGDWAEEGKVLKANKYIADENNIAKFRIRVLGEGGTITIYPMANYNGEAEGQTVREAGIVDQWIGVEVDGAAKTVKFILPDGTIKTHENISTLDIENMRFWMNGVSFDIATM